MRYWWVNQNQTYRQEIGGGYLWSPKRKKDGRLNHFYESMREVAPGDLVFSFCDTRIAAIGFATSFCYESPKPEEFGNAGLNWSTVGWKVEVRFQELRHRVRPKDHIGQLAGHLPAKYSPLTSEGNGLQSVYLTEVGSGFADVLLRLIGPEARALRDLAGRYSLPDTLTGEPRSTLDEWEQRIESAIREAPALPETEKHSLVLARRGQGVFRTQVQAIEKACRVTGVDRSEHLIASHSKPWRDCSNEERLNGENGLLLTPTIDHLFDKGFISFEGNGRLIISPVADRPSLARMGIRVDEPVDVGTFSQGQRVFLEYHQENVLRMARR